MLPLFSLSLSLCCCLFYSVFHLSALALATILICIPHCLGFFVVAVAFALLYCFIISFVSVALPSRTPSLCVCLTTVSHISKASTNRLIVSQASAIRTICFAIVNRLLTLFFFYLFWVVVVVIVLPIVIVVSVGVVAFCYY